MHLPEFSEFTFGFAITENLINGSLPGVKAAPIFPSLKEEGKKGGGYDVEIPRFSAPLFLQFKLPQVVTRLRSKWKHGFTAPYYRMHLMRRDRSSQHASLLAHSEKGRAVFYVAPEFSTRDEINAHYNARRVPLRSAYFDPKDIGPLDGKAHHVAYKPGERTAWLCSEPRILQGEHGLEQLQTTIKRVVHNAPKTGDGEKFFDGLANEIIATASQAEQHNYSMAGDDVIYEIPKISFQSAKNEGKQLAIVRDKLGARGFAAYVSRLYLDSQLFVVGHD